MIVTIKDYEAIRRMYAVEKLSVREIARRTGFSRNTISKYCQGEMMPGMRKEYEQQTVVITDAVKQFVNQCLEEDAIENLSKQKHTAKRIFDRLVEEQGFTGGETTIRRLVKTLRDEVNILVDRYRSSGAVDTACPDSRYHQCYYSLSLLSNP